nr:MAG TPA: protein of unknown function (DUF5320) [Caudoviricetes sp.]
MTNEELQQQIEQLEQQIKDLKVKLESKAKKKPYEVEVPEDIESYYYSDEIGEVFVVGNIIGSHAYKEIYQRGIPFKTEEEVEQYDKERILLFKLHKWAEEHNEGWTPDWEDCERKFYITYQMEYGVFNKSWCVNYKQFTKLPYLKSEEIADQFIKEFGDEIKEVLC